MICDYYLSLSQVQLDQNIDDQISEVGKKKKDLDKLSKNQYYNFYPTDSDLQSLPQNSTLLKISFTLKKPYTSKDEGEFHIIDNKILENPIVRDKFTGLPMVKPTTWKGHLRFAANKVEWQNEQEKKRIIKRLFGSEPEEKDNPLKGRLYFFPTFFNEEAEKDVITPLKRDTRTPARGPIPFEVMKPGKKGDFNLLYFPYPKGADLKEEDVNKDLKFLAEALKLMFYVYGFSAKKTSGFGVIEYLQEANIKVWSEERKKIFSILYTKANNYVNHGA